ncbi:MAG: flap endonuclease, partial [Acidimicrobiia bacterium]
LRTRREEAFLYRELTTLRLDVPLKEELEDLEWQGVPRDRFLAFCDTMGLDPEAVRVDRWAD